MATTQQVSTGMCTPSQEVTANNDLLRKQMFGAFEFLYIDFPKTAIAFRQETKDMLGYQSMVLRDFIQVTTERKELGIHTRLAAVSGDMFSLSSLQPRKVPMILINSRPSVVLMKSPNTWQDRQVPSPTTLLGSQTSEAPRIPMIMLSSFFHTFVSMLKNLRT